MPSKCSSARLLQHLAGLLLLECTLNTSLQFALPSTASLLAWLMDFPPLFNYSQCCLPCAVQMLVALKYMHSAQVIHRDLKPSK